MKIDEPISVRPYGPGSVRAGGARAAGEARLPRHYAIAKWAFVAFCVGIVIRVLIGDGILNLVEHYTSDGGSLVEKIHPSLYLMFLCGFVIYAAVGLRFSAAERDEIKAILLLTGFLTALGVVNIALGRGSSAG